MCIILLVATRSLILVCYCFFFFFSSRRRHTRCSRDWSSDVCSSDLTVIREYCTINRGTAATGKTAVGRRCFLMSYVHLAHDCVVGDDVIIANAVQMAGHVTIEDRAVISGLMPIHQFVRIGTFAFVGGGSRVNQDVPPYTKAVGNPVHLYGLNSVGLQRAGFAPEVKLALKRAYRLLFNSDMTVSQGIAKARG